MALPRRRLRDRHDFVLGHLAIFASATFLLAMSPGPASILVIRQTLQSGRRRAFISIAGVATGLVAWLAAAVLGLSAVVVGSPTLFEAVRLAGAAVMLFLGLRTLLRPAPQEEAAEQERGRAMGAYNAGLL